MNWSGPSQFTVSGQVQSGQVVSVQESFDRRWKAFSQGRELKVKADGLGLMWLDPACQGSCNIEFLYQPDRRSLIYRLLALGAFAALSLMIARSIYSFWSK